MPSSKAVQFDVVASAARTTSSQGTAFSAQEADQLRLLINVTAASGTSPVLVVRLQDSADSSVWYDVAATSNITAAGQYSLPVTVPFADTVRVAWTVTGTTPSFTFKVDALLIQGA